MPPTPLSAFSSSSTRITQGAIASAILQRLASPLLRLTDQRAHERADVQEERGPARLVAQGLGAGRLARTRWPEQEDAAGPDVGPPARPQGAGAERLEGPQAAQVGERLAAPVEGEQAALS